MSTKLFLIASSLLTVMSCINMGQAMENYIYNEIDNDIDFEAHNNNNNNNDNNNNYNNNNYIPINDILNNQFIINDNQRIIERAMKYNQNVINDNVVDNQNRIMHLNNNLNDMRYASENIIGLKKNISHDEIVGKYINYHNYQIDKKVIDIINNFYSKIIQNARKYFNTILDFHYDNAYKLDTKCLETIIGFCDNANMAVLDNDNNLYTESISMLKSHMFLLNKNDDVLQKLNKLQPKISLPRIKNILDLVQKIKDEINNTDNIDTIQLRDNLNTCLQEIYKWNISYNLHLMHVNNGHLHDINNNNNVYYKYFFNTCMDYVRNKASDKDIYHVVKCILYDKLNYQRNENYLLESHINNSIAKLMNISEMKTLLKSLKKAYMDQKNQEEQGDNNSVYDENDGYQNFLEEDNDYNNIIFKDKKYDRRLDYNNGKYMNNSKINNREVNTLPQENNFNNNNINIRNNNKKQTQKEIAEKFYEDNGLSKYIDKEGNPRSSVRERAIAKKIIEYKNMSEACK